MDSEQIILKAIEKILVRTVSLARNVDSSILLSIDQDRDPDQVIFTVADSYVREMSGPKTYCGKSIQEALEKWVSDAK
ncbi:hypothetical protein [Zavarzinia sp.]|uniref:hypothetical protein n=1 Tax=Zavarzinia sp. TaxID=2027920 RepID=UPI003561BC90